MCVISRADGWPPVGSGGYTDVITTAPYLLDDQRRWYMPPTVSLTPRSMSRNCTRARTLKTVPPASNISQSFPLYLTYSLYFAVTKCVLDRSATSLISGKAISHSVRVICSTISERSASILPSREYNLPCVPLDSDVATQALYFEPFHFLVVAHFLHANFSFPVVLL